MSTTAPVRALDPREAHARVQAGAVLLDVRAEEEFADGHPERAVNVPLARYVEGRLVDAEDFAARVRDRFEPETALLVLCRSGVRARRAAEQLIAQYTDVAVVTGGFDGTRGPFGEVVEPGWRRLGLP
jgi:rhodanese-related sulfurtransferase